MYVNIWPSRHYTIKSDAEERQVMLFDYLAPHESIRCEVMSINTDLPALLTVRCKEGIARNITLVPQNFTIRPLFILSTIAVSGVCNFNLHCCCFPPVVVAENRLETFIFVVYVLVLDSISKLLRHFKGLSRTASSRWLGAKCAYRIVIVISAWPRILENQNVAAVHHKVAGKCMA